MTPGSAERLPLRCYRDSIESEGDGGEVELRLASNEPPVWAADVSAGAAAAGGATADERGEGSPESTERSLLSTSSEVVADVDEVCVSCFPISTSSTGGQHAAVPLPAKAVTSSFDLGLD